MVIIRTSWHLELSIALQHLSGLYSHIAQQLEGNVITPNVMGKSLSIHPLTIIVVILAAGDLGGFTLILIAVPLYAVLKTVASNIFKYRTRIMDKANSDVKD